VDDWWREVSSPAATPLLLTLDWLLEAAGKRQDSRRRKWLRDAPDRFPDGSGCRAGPAGRMEPRWRQSCTGISGGARLHATGSSLNGLFEYETPGLINQGVSVESQAAAMVLAQVVSQVDQSSANAAERH